MRSGKVILSVFTLLWGFLQAPFDHIHPDGPEHETAAPAHVHVPRALPGEGPTVSSHTPDDDEIDVLWSVATNAKAAFHADAAIGESLYAPTLSLVSMVVAVPQHRGHDPPEFSPKIPRAPPV